MEFISPAGKRLFFWRRDAKALQKHKMVKEIVIDEKLINYLENLSFMSLSSEERQRIGTDLDNILSGMALLANLDINKASLEVSNFNFASSLRKDEVKASFINEEILKNAPEVYGGCFIVPKTVE